jgi:hypothetical protein
VPVTYHHTTRQAHFKTRHILTKSVMTYYLIDKLLTLSARRAARRDLAAHALSAPLVVLEHFISRALPLAEREAAEYAHTLQEPMPQHLQDALELEVHQWRHLRESIGDFCGAEPNARDVHEYTSNVRTYLSYQMDLLRLEEEMLRACAVRHYDEAIKTLRDKAGAVPL